MKLIKWVIALSLLTSSVANAAFIAQNIAAAGAGSVQVTNANQFTLYSSDNGIDDVSDHFYSFTYTDIAASDLKINFDWSYQTFDEDGSWAGGNWLDPVGIIVNGVKAQLNTSVLSYEGIELGIYSFNVTAGSTFGFYADTHDNVAGPGAFSISSLTITPVPEPESAALLLAGLGLIGLSKSTKRIQKTLYFKF